MGRRGRSARRRGIRRRPVITSEDPNFVRNAATWAATADVASIDPGLSREEARRRAVELIRMLRRGPISNSETPLSSDDIDILYAACELLTERFAGRAADDSSEISLYDIVAKMPPPGRSFEQAGALADSVDMTPQSTGLLDDARRLFEYVSAVHWPTPDFGEQTDLLVTSAFIAWRIARVSAPPNETDAWQQRVSAAESLNLPSAQRVIEDWKTDPICPRAPETLLPLLENLRTRWETAPEQVLEESIFLYLYLERLKPRYPTDAFLLDEREYFLGESAYIAGAVCRNQSLRDQARHWFDLAEAWFLLTENAAGNISKVNYQRLAIRVEERDFPPVLELLPRLLDSFQKLGMQEDFIKAKFLEANVLRESDRLPEAVEVFKEIAAQAKAMKNDRLVAHAYVNLVQIDALLGNSEEATVIAAEATPLLRRLGNRTGLGKLQWGVGYLLRAQQRLLPAIEAFRAAQSEFRDLGMRADVAAVHLVIADLLLDAGQDRQAEWEIRQALPIIDEYKLVPEGFAALSLLRESLRRQKIDRQALRNLHGYFQDEKS